MLAQPCPSTARADQSTVFRGAGGHQLLCCMARAHACALQVARASSCALEHRSAPEALYSQGNFCRCPHHQIPAWQTGSSKPAAPEQRVTTNKPGGGSGAESGQRTANRACRESVVIGRVSRSASSVAASCGVQQHHRQLSTRRRQSIHKLVCTSAPNAQTLKKSGRRRLGGRIADGCTRASQGGALRVNTRNQHRGF